MSLSPTEVMYAVAAALLILGEAIALAKVTDRDQPITYYIRSILKLGPAGFLILLATWLWLGCHFLLDVNGSLPC